jgi:hypothetical protein
MVGTINLALTQQLDEFGEPLSGGQLYFIQAGTVSTPQNAFQDAALSTPWPNPITLDAAGRIPMFYLADGQIKVRLQDSMGVVKFSQDNLMVVGPSSGGGGGGSVDPTTVMQTGDLKFRYDNAIITGFVRLNGLTIGSAASGATEAASAQCNALFLYLWATDATLAVTPSGRGASAAADWAANKQIALPDGRSKLIGALDQMGNTSLGYWTNVAFSKGNATTLGSLGGLTNTTLTLTAGNLPTHQHNVYLKDPTHFHSITGANQYNTNFGLSPGAAGFLPQSIQAGNSGSASTGITIGSVNGVANDNKTDVGIGLTGTGFNVCPPIMLITVYMKL